LSIPIARAAYALVRGDLPAPSKSGLCLQLVRLVVESAYGMKPHEFYRWRTHPVERLPGDDNDPWARDMERSLREAGMAALRPDEGRYVSTETLLLNGNPGDLLFRWDTAKNARGSFVGHVGILLGGGLVLENVNPAYRPASLMRGVTALTPVSKFLTTLAVRFVP
jgi:hypothetical protein